MTKRLDIENEAVQAKDQPSTSGRLQRWKEAFFPWRNKGQRFQRLDTEDLEGFPSAQDQAGHRPEGRWCPEEDAGILSRLLFLYADSLIQLGYQKPLEEEDVWDLADRDKAEAVSQRFEACLQTSSGSVWKAMWRCHGRPFVKAGLIKFVHDVIMFTGPLFLQQLLRSLELNTSVWVGLGLAVGLGASSVVETLLINQYFHILFRISLHLKVGLIDMLYAKSLRITSSVRSTYGVGAIVNLQSNDAAKLYNLAQYAWMLVSAPLQILVVMAMLVRVLHWVPAACGLASTIALIPLTIFTGRRLASIRKGLMLRTDARIKLCSEVVTGVKAIKLYAWEEPYLEKLTALRELELKDIRRAALWTILNSVIFFGGPILISLASFTTYTLLGLPLTADVAFVSLALFNMLRFPVMMFPNQIMNIINGRVALKRMQKFMEEEEMVQPALEAPAQPHAAAIKVVSGMFGWDSSGDAVLRGINLEVLQGQLLMVVGECGSGKSSLLSAIMSEMRVWGGNHHVAGTLAYTAQDPWIQNATLRDNILMGNPYVEEKYRAVVMACALEADLALLPAGDASEIGEKGINLSGGQRHRVALARACYADADVLLLDDPLSAVDAHVGQHIWSHCVQGLLASKTRVLVTHHMHWLPSSDLIAVLQGGKITHLGTYEALESQVDFHKFEIQAEEQQEGNASSARPSMELPHSITNGEPARQPSRLLPASLEMSQLSGAHVSSLGSDSPRIAVGVTANEHSNDANDAEKDEGASSSHSSSDDKEVALPDAFAQVLLKTAEALETDAVHLPSMLSADLDDMPKGALSGLGHKQDVALTIEEAEAHEEVALLPAKTSVQDQGKIVKVEERSIGSVELSVYRAYITAWGPIWLPIAIFGTAIAERLTGIGQNYWLKVWSDGTSAAIRTGRPVDTRYYLSVYFAFGIGALILLACRNASVVEGTINAARRLHERLLHKVMRMPMSFFDSQPTGRLLNRFSRDTEALDTSLGNTASMFLTCFVSVMGSMLVVLAVTPLVLLAVVPLSVAYRYIQIMYIATSRELKRLDSLAMSPIFGHFSESLSGLLSLRAFRQQAFFAQGNRDKLNASNRIYWVIQNVNRWLSVRLELLGIAVVFTTAIVVVVFPTNAGLAGLALTSALTLTGLLNWLIRMSAELEVSMNAVERMIEYNSLGSEAPPYIEGNRPEPEWPQDGAISVHKLEVKYRPDLPPVISNLSFATRAKEKIGIAGRTGCGKSTLTMALYRIVEPSGGLICIDGLDICSIGLTDLRSRLALVPQDPVIFSGSVRSNLDPFDTAGGDQAIWRALERANMAGAIRALPEGLDANLTEGGGNLSTGQRQLLCMARALLRKARILILDEATSSIDPESDATIQATIRAAFAECTVLTIAHRLHTIMDSDRILILDAGKCLEFDSPRTLMKDPRSAFSKLVAESRRHGGVRSRNASAADLSSH